MALFTRDAGRKRTKRFDLDAASRGPEQSRLLRAFSSERRLDTLFAIFFAGLEVGILTLGIERLDSAVLAGLAMLTGAMNLTLALFVAEEHEDLLEERRRVLLFHVMTACALLLAKLFVLARWPIFLYPLGVFAFTASIVQGPPLAIVWSFFIAGAAGLMQAVPAAHPYPVAFSSPVAISLGGGAALGVLFLGRRLTHRGRVIRAGALTGLCTAALIVATTVLLKGRGGLDEAAARSRDLALEVGFGMLNGIFTGYFMVEFGLRFIESAFEVVTDLRLQELADLNQPILKKFSIEAPGTFHHSQMVGTLAEAAAEAIDANALLCRVGAHFHDIGKMAKPEYYIENINAGGPTKHDGLTPNMSTLIIVAHVKDGIEMAEEIGLPQCVIDCIPEHHGTIAVEYFFHRAVQAQKQNGGPEPSRDDFRYPGPKPQSRETAILMIADSVEAISRVLTEPNPTRIAEMVHDVVKRRLDEGQLDECSITLVELKKVEEAMCRVLMGVFHGRIKYPRAATIDRPSEGDSEAGPDEAAEPVPAGTAAAPARNGNGKDAGQGEANGLRVGAEDTARRIKVAALAADGPGVPTPKPPPG